MVCHWHLCNLLPVFIRHLLIPFLIKLNHKCLFIGGHRQLLESLREAMLSFLEGSFASETHFVAKRAFVVTMLGQTDTLHDTATIGWDLIELNISLLHSFSLETLKQAVDTHLHFVLRCFSICCLSWEIDGCETTLFSELIVRGFNVVFFSKVLIDFIIESEILFICDLLVADITIAQTGFVNSLQLRAVSLHWLSVGEGGHSRSYRVHWADFRLENRFVLSDTFQVAEKLLSERGRIRLALHNVSSCILFWVV